MRHILLKGKTIGEASKQVRKGSMEERLRCEPQLAPT